MGADRGKEEIRQALTRLGVCTVALLLHLALFASGKPFPVINIPIILAYSVFSMIWWTWVRRTPWHYPWRPYSTMVGDIGMTCLLMATIGDFSFYFYPLFLWMIAGYGIRFGPRYLLVAWLGALTMFSFVLVSTPFWLERVHLATSLLLVMIILPWFFLVLVTRLQGLNRGLASELATNAALLRESEQQRAFLEAINAEGAFEHIAQIIVDQSIALFPEVEKARFLLYDSENHDFRFLAFRGYDDSLAAFRINPQQIIGSLEKLAEKIAEGIYLFTRVDRTKMPSSFRDLPEPKAALAMPFHNEGELIGLLVLDNHSSEEAFAEIETGALDGFRHHVRVAAGKAWLLQSLQRRNHELTVRQNQLVLQEKMASLGSLTAGLAHEIQNPLNFITNFADISVERLSELRALTTAGNDGNEKALACTLDDLEICMQKIQSHGLGLARVVNTMQRLATEEKSATSVKLHDTITECVNLVLGNNIIHFNFAVTTAFDPRIGSIQTYGQSLNRVLVNLLDNAREAVLDRIEREPGFRGHITVKTRAEIDAITISISDNGGGLSPELEPMALEPFFTTKSPGRGHIGLGLAICHETVTSQLRGRFDMQNKAGEGISFTIRLPSCVLETRRSRGRSPVLV